MHYDLDMLNGPSEIWLNSTECITNILTNTKNQIQSKECYCIKYDLFEPSCEEIKNDFIQIGKYRGEDNNFYRYTSMFFFGEEFKTMLKNSSVIEITFELNYDSPMYLGTNNDDSKSIFNNNILLIGHSFESQDELMIKWNDEEGYDELKYNTSCPFVVSIYDDLRKALINKDKTFSMILNEGIVREFEKHNIKGLHLYCHDNINGVIRIVPKCTAKVLRLRNFFDDVIYSKDAYVISNKHIYDVNYLDVGSPHSDGIFLFGDDFENILNQAMEAKVTIDLSWFNPSKEAVLINTNSNYIKENTTDNTIVLSGHGFKNSEDLYNCKTKRELFELDKDNYKIEVHSSFKKAIDEGRSSYTFTLNEDDLEMFKLKGTKGLKIGFKNDHGSGHWRMSKVCTIEITKYKDNYKPLYIPTEKASWCNINESGFIGHKLNKDNGDSSVFYFFDSTLYNTLNYNRVQNVTVRFYFDYDSLNMDSNNNIRYLLCAHNYHNIEEIMNEDHIKKANGICEFHVSEDVDYIDIILSKQQIEFLKNYNGLCVYSKQNTTLTKHKNLISVYVDYVTLEECTSIREFEPLSLKTFIVEDQMTYDKKFICGATGVGYLYKPFMYLGDNFNDFMNKMEVVNVKILITADHINYYDERPSAKLLNDICFYTHNISVNENNYKSYNYKDLLFKTDLGNSRYVEIDLNNKQIDLLKNSFGLGAIVDNNTNNDFVVINSFKVIVTYVNLV